MSAQVAIVAGGGGELGRATAMALAAGCRRLFASGGCGAPGLASTSGFAWNISRSL